MRTTVLPLLMSAIAAQSTNISPPPSAIAIDEEFIAWYKTNQVSLLSLGIDQKTCQIGVWWYTRGVISFQSTATPTDPFQQWKDALPQECQDLIDEVFPTNFDFVDWWAQFEPKWESIDWGTDIDWSKYDKSNLIEKACTTEDNLETRVGDWAGVKKLDFEDYWSNTLENNPSYLEAEKLVQDWFAPEFDEFNAETANLMS